MHPLVNFAGSIAFGDNVQAAPLVGATEDFVRHLGGETAQGRMFVTAFEAVTGANAPDKLGQEDPPSQGRGARATEPEGYTDGDAVAHDHEDGRAGAVRFRGGLELFGCTDLRGQRSGAGRCQRAWTADPVAGSCVTGAQASGSHSNVFCS